MTDSQAVLMDRNENDNDSHSIDKLIPYSLDDLYVDYFLLDPSNKTEAYRNACLDLGKEYNESTVTQLAYLLHKRLAERIQAELLSLTVDDKALGRSRLRYLAQSANSESVQASTATTLYKSGDNLESGSGITVNVNRDNVTITHKDQSIKISSED